MQVLHRSRLRDPQEQAGWPLLLSAGLPQHCRKRLLVEQLFVPLENPKRVERAGIILLIKFHLRCLFLSLHYSPPCVRWIRSRAELHLENLALRHQVGVLHRVSQETVQIDARGSTLLGLPLPHLARLAELHTHALPHPHQAREPRPVGALAEPIP